MTFIAPWFLIGLIAAGIPLLLHLRRRRDHRRIVFSTNQFFDERFLRSARRARLQNLLLMLLRMALLALLVLALAQPLFHFGRFTVAGSFTDGPRRVAIVIDDSASMARVGPKGTAIDQAKKGADRLLDELSTARGDRATVILAGQRAGGAKLLFGKPTAEFAAVRKAIDRIKPTGLGTDLNAAVTAAAHSLGTAPGQNAGGGNRQVYVFSDLARSAFATGRKLSAGATTTLVMVNCGADRAGKGNSEPADVSVDAIQYGAARPTVAIPFTFRALVRNHGDDPQQLRVDLMVNKKTVDSIAATVAAKQSQVVRFSHSFDRPGWYAGRIVVHDDSGADPFKLDHTRYFAVHVEGAVHVLAVDGEPSRIASHDELFFFRLALTAQPASGSHAGITVDTTTPKGLSADKLDGHDVVVLANVSSLSDDALAAVEHYADRGGTVLFTLGDRCRRDVYNAWDGPGRLHHGLLPATIGKRFVGDAAANATTQPHKNQAGRIAWVDDQSTMLAGFRAGELGSLTNVYFSNRFHLTPRAGSRVLMQGPDGGAILVSHPFGRGLVLLFASTIDRDWTNFPLKPTYVPFLYRLITSSLTPSLGTGNFVRTGDVVTLPRAATQADVFRIVLPGGGVAKASSHLEGGAGNGEGISFSDTASAGVYRVFPVAAHAAAPRGPAIAFAANTPANEYRQASVDGHALKTLAAKDTPLLYLKNPALIGSTDLRATRGVELWNWLLWIALAAALVEPWIAKRLSLRRREAARIEAASEARVVPDELTSEVAA